MRRTSFAEMICPIARSLDVVGEWWTLLIVRDAFMGARRFEDFRRTGIADNILSARLDRLVDTGVLVRQRYQEHPPRDEYLLTEKGRDLLPVLSALTDWGLRWTEWPPVGRPPEISRFLHTRCGTDVSQVYHCPTCDEIVPTSEVELRRPTPLGVAGSSSERTGQKPIFQKVEDGVEREG